MSYNVCGFVQMYAASCEFVTASEQYENGLLPNIDSVNPSSLQQPERLGPRHIYLYVYINI